METRKVVSGGAAGLALLLVLVTVTVWAQVNVSIGVNVPPPAFVVPSPPEVIVIPRTYVYFVPGVEVDILFYRGHWYRPYEGRWYRGRSYNGPWTFLAPAKVPRALISLPDYRDIPPGHRKIPHGQLQKNWGHWERTKHWEKDRDWRGPGPGRSDDRREEGRGHGKDGKERGRGHEGGKGKGHGRD